MTIELPAMYQEIQDELEAIEQERALYVEKNFVRRAETLDFLEFNIIDRIDGLLQKPSAGAALVALKNQAEQVRQRLEAVDDQLFEQLRATIRQGTCTGEALKQVMSNYIPLQLTDETSEKELAYDQRDLFINGLLLAQPIPNRETKMREADMIYYQQTPAQIIFELIAQAQLTPQDVFFDLGSGLGHVPILMNLLSGAKTIGVEFEPAYCTYAQACAASLNLANVEFINTDARAADYSKGNVFFMYTPFSGTIMQTVLAKLRAASDQRAIKLFTYGTCTLEVATQSWLTCSAGEQNNPHRLSLFSKVVF